MVRLFHYILAWFCLTVFCSCSSGGSGSSDNNGDDNTSGGGTTTKTEAKPRYIWIDASANFPEFADSKDNIRRDLTKAKDAGFTDIVVDIRPTTGDVLYQTSYTEQITKLPYWSSTGSYTYYERKATWDYLQAFIDIGHELGLKVDAAFNTFIGGYDHPYGLGEQGMLFRDNTKKSWATTLNLSTGLTNEMDLTSTNPSDANYYGIKFLNPANDEVQTYILNLIGDLCKYNVDAIFLDRCRFNNLMSDFSDVTKNKFLSYLNKESIDFPSDIMKPGTSSLPATKPTYFKDWLSFRAKIIYDFIGKVVDKVHSINNKIKVGVYVGAWYKTYYEVGVNWASQNYKTQSYYPEWANADYSKYGFAKKLDYMLIGAYAPTTKIYGTIEGTMQGYCLQAKEKIKGDVKFAGGPDVGNSTGFEKGGQETAVTNSVDACINVADGYFVFDMVHVRKFNYWDAIKLGINKYLKSIK